MTELFPNLPLRPDANANGYLDTWSQRPSDKQLTLVQKLQLMAMKAAAAGRTVGVVDDGVQPLAL